MKIKNYSEVKDQLRTKLPEYLSLKGINPQHNFKCINPLHKEQNPSCGVLPDKLRFHCLSCGITGDIFDACHFLEGKANSGSAFISDNLQYLAKAFGIAIEVGAMTEDEVLELDSIRACEAVASLLITEKIDSPEVREELKNRKWSRKTLETTRTGWVPSAEYILEGLTKLGFTTEFAKKIGLTDPNIFNSSSIIFTITDEHGRAVGFSARNVDWTPESGEPKYYNTSNSVSAIYHKGKRLYNLHNAIKYVRQKSLPLYIMEGYGDVLSAIENDFNHCCAIGGTALTVDHVLLLRELGISNIVLCLDGDKAGQDKVEKILDNRLTNVHDINVKVVIIPEEQDPDDYIRAQGITTFKELKCWSAFEWRLLRFPDDIDPEQICQAMIPLIVSEPSLVTQEKMAQTLASYTNISAKTILAELARLQDDRSRKLAQERAVIIDRMMRTLTSTPEEAEVALNSALTGFQELDKKYNEDKLSEESCVKLLDDQKTGEEAKSGEFGGFKLGMDLKELEDALCGEWRKDVLMVFGGKANSGKTSLLAKIAYEIASHKENNACCIYLTIDDTAAQFLPKWVCVAEGSRQLAINHVRAPNYWEAAGVPDIKARREAGYNSIRDLMKQGRLVLKDSNDGTTIVYAESVIRFYKEKYPDRNIVFFLDNFHKLKDYSAEDERIRFKVLSQAIKGIANKYHIPIICTMEYTKLPAGVKPTNNNIAETVQIEYDSNLIAHLYNEAHELGLEAAETTGLTHAYMFHGQVMKLPVIELYIGKNKITEFKNRIFFDFYPACSDFTYRNTSEVEAQIQTQLKENKPKAFNKEGSNGKYTSIVSGGY